MKMFRLIPALVAAGAVMFLAGCGDKEEADSAPPSPPGGAARAPATGNPNDPSRYANDPNTSEAGKRYLQGAPQQGGGGAPQASPPGPR